MRKGLTYPSLRRDRPKSMSYCQLPELQRVGRRSAGRGDGSRVSVVYGISSTGKITRLARGQLTVVLMLGHASFRNCGVFTTPSGSGPVRTPTSGPGVPRRRRSQQDHAGRGCRNVVFVQAREADAPRQPVRTDDGHPSPPASRRAPRSVLHVLCLSDENHLVR